MFDEAQLVSTGEGQTAESDGICEITTPPRLVVCRRSISGRSSGWRTSHAGKPAIAAGIGCAGAATRK